LVGKKYIMKSVAVIPAYNEETRVRRVVEKASQYVDQVIVIDDGSSDRTWESVQGVNEKVIPLRHKINLGKGAAMKTGCEAALKKGAEIIVLMDADEQHKPEKISDFLKILENDEVDIVFGSRSIGRDMPIIKMLGNKFFSLTSSILFKIYISDTQSGFKAFKTSIYPKIRWDSSDYSVETEIVVNAGKNKLKFREIDIETIYTNIYKGTTFVDGIRIFINMLIWRIS